MEMTENDLFFIGNDVKLLEMHAFLAWAWAFQKNGLGFLWK